MDLSAPRFQVGDYIILTRTYAGIPEGSVGVITAVEERIPRGYHIHFGDSVPRRIIPEHRLAQLKGRQPRTQ